MNPNQNRLRTGQNGAPGANVSNQIPSRPMGTASRLATAMRPSSRGGAAGGSFNQPFKVEDRPMTQQGVSGLKTANKGPRRQVEDKSYYIGLIRSKMNELQQEINILNKKIKDTEEEGASFVQYEQMAEKLAKDIKDLQGELGDYNMLVDKLNVDEDMGNIQLDLEDMKTANDRADRSLEMLFEEKKDKEAQLRNIELELEQERRMADNLVANMQPEMRQKYIKLKELNDHLLKQLEKGEQNLDGLNIKKDELERELAMSQVKQEAMILYSKMYELEAKRDQLVEETRSKGDPHEEREKLLKSVKEDNQEIATMERQTNELKEKMNEFEEDIRLIDRDLEEGTGGERNAKYKELKKKEQQMDEFMESYESNKINEFERGAELEGNIVALLERMSRNLARGTSQLPSQQALAEMKDQLEFKTNELSKSEHTTHGLAQEHAKLQQDLLKVDQLDAKMRQEIIDLNAKMARMESEMVVYSDIETLKQDAEVKKKKLIEDKSILTGRRDHLKKLSQKINAEYEAARKKLNDNETHAQLCNLERKWQQHEQNNFVMKEFIALKTAETSYQLIGKRVNDLINSFNSQIKDQLSKKSAM